MQFVSLQLLKTQIHTMTFCYFDGFSDDLLQLIGFKKDFLSSEESFSPPISCIHALVSPLKSMLSPFPPEWHVVGPMLWSEISQKSRIVRLSWFLWELSLISSIILQYYENMLKSLLLINSSDIVFLFISNKQGNWNKYIKKLLTLLVLVLEWLFL